jgi:hypothetical protein
MLPSARRSAENLLKDIFMFRVLGVSALFGVLFFMTPASAMSNNVISQIEAALAFGDAVVCDVSHVASVALVVEQAVNQGKTTPLIREGATASVQAASQQVCQSIGGVAQQSAAVR